MTKGKTVVKTFHIGGLNDDFGQKEVEHNLIQIDGVKKVRVSIKNHLVDVEYDPNIIESDFLEETLNALGYSTYI